MRARTDIPVEQVVDELEYFKIEHADFVRAHAEKLAEAAKRREAMNANNNGAGGGEGDDGDDELMNGEEEEEAAVVVVVEEEEVDEFEAARAQGPEAMFNIANAKIWNATSRREITKSRNFLLGLSWFLVVFGGFNCLVAFRIGEKLECLCS